jgi:hypothetical protein
MSTQIAGASRIIEAPAEQVYHLIADYRDGHARILPKPYFLSLDVEEGGFGEGTIIRFQMRILGQTQTFRAHITEPDPGRVLRETDLLSGIETTFTILPFGDGTRSEARIGTELKDRGRLEGFTARLMLQKIYQQELQLLARISEAAIPA